LCIPCTLDLFMGLQVVAWRAKALRFIISIGGKNASTANRDVSPGRERRNTILAQGIRKGYMSRP